jgi:hypothetical protein
MNEKQSDEFTEITFNNTVDSQTIILKKPPKRIGKLFLPQKEMNKNKNKK